jgi:chromosome segregation protein
MFFKKIEMTGFKSFANRTEVLFRPGVTVIVGPNGCGKSNIFDAVRWVLGEQKPKSLRGQRMGDVIFSGSATHAATALAQVSLTVSNEDRRLPIDYNEVTITRRLLRTGDSEYMINRHPCRLRDVIELFLDTGVGTNAYSIMEQGRIDQIINARPIDRREIFEEAAGVSKYRARRGEAQRRLDRTEEDLVRLADIIAEVRRQANSLKRQASRAARYKRISGELQELEMRLLVHRWRSHQRESEAVGDQVTSMQDRLTGVSTRLSQLDAEHEQRLSRTEELSREMHDLTSAISAKSASIHDAEHRVGLLRQRIEINTGRMEDRSSEVESHRERHASLAEEMEKIEDQRVEREAALVARELVHTERRQESERLRDGLSRGQRDLTDLRRRMSDRRADQLNVDNQIRLAALMGEKVEEERKVVAAQREEVGEELTKAEGSLVEREKTHRSKTENLGKVVDRLEGMEARLSDLSDEEREVTEAVQGCQSTLAETQSRLSALRALEARHEGYREGVRLVLQAAEKGELKGILGTVASLIHPEREHETAIEAALDGDEQVILARTARDRDAAVAWLREGGRGRATVLAVGSIGDGSRRDEKIVRRDEVMAWADDVVSCEEEIEPAVRELLGSALIVCDLETGLPLSADGTAARCVTPEGEVAVGGVRLTGGRLQRSGLLSREREIGELAEKAERLESENQELQHRRDALGKTRGELEAECRELAVDRQRQEIRCAELGKDREMAKREVDAVRQRDGRLEWRLGELDSQSEEHLDTRETAAERLDEIRAEIGGLEEEMKRAEGESASQGEEAQRLAEEVQALAIEVARAREQFETLRLRQESTRSEHDDVEQRIATAMAECARLGAENTEATSQIGELEANLVGLLETRRELEARANTQRGESDSAGLALKKLSQEIHVVTRERNELQNRLHDLEVQSSQHAMHLQHCEDEAGEKFQKAMSEILAEHPDVIEDAAPIRGQASELREKLAAMGPVNVIAIEEYEGLRERLEQTISELDRTSTELFTESFTQIRENFQATFRRLFGGGRADLVALEPENLFESGIEIIAQPPGKKLQSISLLSGGEKALTAIALLFGIFLQKPSPFCVLDEIDAPLDDKNIGRFKDMLSDFCQTTQFIIITHNKLTMQLADTLFGITMEELGVSRLVGVDIQAAVEYAA